ncbi:hypothetical protein [Phocaeicola sp. HCN-6420]|uniref:hypothetical protein n=1 Tax=Phocaeicola sp. HCN-6420 TaxID=3134673 RepID=UPI0030BE68C3
MKRLNIIAIAICLLSFFSCQSTDKNQQKDSDTTELNNFVSGLVKEDTTAVEKLVNTYMTYAQNKQYAEAAAMLFKPDTADIWNEPIPLDNDEMESVKAVLKRFPVQSYKITEMKFRTAVDNEIRCSFVMNESSNVTSSWTFRAMNYLGGWRLCLMK